MADEVVTVDKTGVSGRASAETVLKTALLVLLGLLWSVRLAAIKAAGLAGVPVHVVVAVSALGIGLFFTAVAAARGDWPPLTRTIVRFYVLSGTFGFLAPFMLESVVAPHLPVFVFVVIIATMPLITLALSILHGSERLRAVPILAVGLGFASAVTILFETGRIAPLENANAGWVALAFGVPTLYAINTVFVATRWPARVGAVHVAHAQALIVAGAALLGSVATGAVADWRLVTLGAPAVGLIVVGEGSALLVYLRIARDHGATYVSFANYVSMVFAAIIGAVVFGDRVTGPTVLAAGGIVASVILYQRHARGSPSASRGPRRTSGSR